MYHNIFHTLTYISMNWNSLTHSLHMHTLEAAINIINMYIWWHVYIPFSSVSVTDNGAIFADVYTPSHTSSILGFHKKVISWIVNISGPLFLSTLPSPLYLCLSLNEFWLCLLFTFWIHAVFTTFWELSWEWLHQHKRFRLFS